MCLALGGDRAEIMFTDSRLPVPATTGVRPTGAQVVPEWWSVRTPASSAKKMVAPAAAASTCMAGYSSSFQRRTRSGSCS